MKLYHTSNTIVNHPDIKYSREYLDFGKGFYLTKIKNQAEKYGLKFLRKGENAYLNIYELDEYINKATIIYFEKYDKNWLDYITACRKGLNHFVHDIIIGGIADDQVFDTIDLYFSGIYNEEQALNLLQYKKPNQQLCITNQRIIDKHLHFIEAIKL